MAHEIRLSTNEDGEVLATCAEPDHDWYATVATPGDVVTAVVKHNEDLRRDSKPGLYAKRSATGFQPIVYRRGSDGRWWQTEHWSNVAHVDVANLEFVGEWSEK